ncbi:hypothetical protein J010_05191 [Cryptococcus neoformans]|nr:hypothetical protein C355_05232 [Cryptococcus neoformans var. grubii Th84]OXH04796.1 hypothetical protein J010_05191 [Cryptococcus neoformans var. grubii]OXH26566.1 hypothetical protein J009_05190 [Cryptococcus neoformans var. grubii]OXH46347.1 hypothetical protein J004_05244 [Cryptococcus neoformans var. grubii]OXH47309.1 hypothetical protein J003_05139 [Cryptococcus neoformans var. grubii]
MPMLFTVLTILNSLLALEVAAYEVLYELQGATGTVYYDYDWENTGDQCAARFGAGWASDQTGYPGCEQNGPTQTDLKTNRIVAMNQTWMEADKSAWCGKEVKVFKEDGIELVYDEPLVLWDTCAECAVHVKIDFSVGPYILLDSEGCGTTAVNPSGLIVQVVDNQIWAPALGSDSYSPTSASTLYTGGLYNFPSPGTLSNPWGATISGDAAGDPVVIATADGQGVAPTGRDNEVVSITATATSRAMGTATGAATGAGVSSEQNTSPPEATSGFSWSSVPVTSALFASDEESIVSVQTSATATFATAAVLSVTSVPLS